MVLAHSLGGIACFDLFVSKTQVDLFVTVGSQAPFLYEINALQSLPFGEPLPKHFPRWVNFMICGLSKLYWRANFPQASKGCEGGQSTAVPESHSAYWSNPVVWEVLAKEIP